MHAPKGHRLAYLASQYPAPSHTFIRREISALRKEGWDIDAFSIRPGCWSTDDDQGREETARTFVVLKRPLRHFASAHLIEIFGSPRRYFAVLAVAMSHRAPGLRALMLSCAHFAEAVLLGRELQRRNIDHLHNHFANSGATVGMLAAKLAGIGWSFTMHGISETDYPAGLLLGRKIEAAQFVVCASWFMRAQGLRTVLPDQWHKLHVVRCGVVADETLRATRKRAMTSLICVGRLSPEKGHAGLIQAFAGLSKAHPRLHLTLVGDGPYRELLESLAREAGIADKVEFLGARSEASTLLEIANSDVLVLPSFLEGLPIVLMEAMASGVPVVAPRIAGIPELVHDGISGLLFTPSDWDELADRILQLTEDSELYASISRRGREVTSGEFNVRLSASRLSELFGAQLSGSSSPKLRRHRMTFGLREAIVLSVIAFLISVAVAITTGNLSSPSSQPLARSASSSK